MLLNSHIVSEDIIVGLKIIYSNILQLNSKINEIYLKWTVYIKRMTMIVEKSIIKHVFYPVFPPNLHVNEVIKWLKVN